MRTTKLIVLSSLFILLLVSGFLVKILIKSTPNIEKPVTNNVNVEQHENQKLSKFYFRGTFSTSEPVVYENYEIIIFITTVKNVYENFDNPDYIEPEGYVRLLDRKNNYKDYYGTNLVISKEKLFFKSNDTPIGVITLQGSFVDKQGRAWDKMYAINDETILKGTLTIEKNGEFVYSKLEDFVYWDGSGD
jgi:hypothetical protein